ncbi:glycosyltransferase [uncultured Gilvimarinus sp.]|uniref:glycosyltransferase n=1 Tax=uncultured Gilvimarinus sp. TaxID=1689143 RepID=UPI0030EEFE06|tara:strand:- start:105 stop:2525 length:2421 start_codon:yes stop_codon:yes gene_type:complete
MSDSLPQYDLYIEVLSAQELCGWIVDSAAPGRVFDFTVQINGKPVATVQNNLERADLKAIGKSEGQGGFKLILVSTLLAEGTNEVALALPEGQVLPLGHIISSSSGGGDDVFVGYDRPVTVIVPIYNALNHVAVCIERLLAYTSPDVRILLIDDASTDEAVAPLLAQAERYEHVEVLHNEVNIGFTKTVNRGIKYAGQDDVVLLNSDARVTPRWLQGLQRALYSDSRIATITPVSNNAGAFSAPEQTDAHLLLADISEPDYARAFRRYGAGLSPSVPTGNGFCMYIRRGCLHDVGLFDEEAFPRGYGEENDFCMRARRKGWRHVVDDRTYVFHERNQSFGAERDTLINAGAGVVAQRYPEYEFEIGVFSASSAFATMRTQALDAVAHARQNSIRPRVLFVVATQTGGTPKTNLDLMRAVAHDYEPWLLRCDSAHMYLSSLDSNGELQTVKSHDLTESVEPLQHVSFEYDRVIKQWLERYDFDLLHIRHLAWHSVNLPKLAKQAGARVIKSVHDFYDICPTVKLLDADNKFCGGNCNNSRAAADCANSMWAQHPFPALKSQWIGRWREIFAGALSHSDALVTTSHSARDTVKAALPAVADKAFHVIPHGRDFTEFALPAVTLSTATTLNLLVPGTLDAPKGADYLLALLECDASKRLQIHLLGECEYQPLAQHPQVVLHGPYERNEFVSRAQSIGAQIGAVLSVWDETWCHTLTELWAAGLPCFVLDFPTLKARVEASGAGWVLDPADPQSSYERMVNLAPEDYAQKALAVRAWQQGEGQAHSTAWMAQQYIELYQSLLAQPGRELR